MDEREIPDGSSALTIVWVALVAAASVWWATYQGTPGAAALAPERWPNTSAIALGSERSTLVTVIHPRCSCSSATLVELGSLMREISERVDAYAVFVVPPGSDDEWRNGELWDRANSIAGLTVVLDEGEESERFGARTSGQILLYEPTGQLIFAGGITPSRGHQGESAGAASVRALVGDGDEQAIARTNVYGCALQEPENQL